jgi:hypothetical protein
MRSQLNQCKCNESIHEGWKSVWATQYEMKDDKYLNFFGRYAKRWK